MPTEKKKQIVANLVEEFNKAQTIIFVNYQGLSNPQLEELRKSIEKEKGKFLVAKNTLIRLALQQCGLIKENKFSLLTAPTAIVFGFENAITPLKSLSEFVKEWNLPKIKSGFLQKEFLSAKEVLELAQLPTREELIIKLTTQLSSPLLNLHNTLLAPLVKLSQNLLILSQQKS